MQKRFWCTAHDMLQDIALEIAGPAMLKYHGVPGTVVSTLKGDLSPVTKADLVIDDEAARVILEAYPNCGIIREEGKNINEGASTRFTIDGIDGTAEYSRGGTDAVFAAAMEVEDKVRYSVIYNPLRLAPLMFHATSTGGAYLNGRELAVSPVRDTSKYPVVEIATAPGGPERIPVQRMLAIGQELQERGFLVNVAKSISYSNAMVAAGVTVGTIFPWRTLWDIMPGDLLVREAGGRTSDLRGKPISYRNGSVDGTIMSNGHLHDLLVEVVAKYY